MGANSNWKSASEKCVIGNDVWIAAGASILRGVTVGDGAVIGASTVVTKDVPPYAIVVGNPGKILRMRYNEEIVERLLKLKWWDFPDDIIRKNLKLFQAELTMDVIEALEDIKKQL